MKYLVIPAFDEKKATHKDGNDKLFMIVETSDNTKIRGKSILVDNLDGYTEVQSYTAQQAAELEVFKKEAIRKLENQSSKDLSKGVAVGNMTLGAKAEDMNAFTQGLVLLAAAESVSGISAQADGGNQITDSTMISSVFGRGVVDTKGVLHDMTIQQYKQMALGYGLAIGTKEANVLAKVAAINAATSIKDVEAVLAPPVAPPTVPSPPTPA